MKQNINRLIILIVALVASTATVSAQAWVDKLINRYKNSDKVEKQISINRDPETRKVVREDYIFNFSAAKEYNYVKSELVKHSNDAEYFQMVDEKTPRVTLRNSTGNQRTTVDIVRLGKHYRLTINRTDNTNADVAETVRQAQEQARQAREQALQAKRQAQEQALQAKRQAQEQALQAKRQAREQARQAKRQAQEIHRQNQLRHNLSGEITRTTVISSDSAANTAAIAAQREQLRQAKSRRK